MEKYNQVTDAEIKELQQIVGKDRVLLDFMEKYPYAMDGTLFDATTIPEVVIQPSTTKEISQIMQLANKHRIPITPRGSGTSLAGNPLPIYGGILLDISRMDKIEEINIADNIVIVEPGVICDTLNQRLAREGYFFPPDPGSSSAATIGGMVANNSGGLQAFKYGVTANYILWLEVVLPTGEIMEFGSKTLKSVSSLNIAGLLIGSEGTLGIVTKIGLKIRPQPSARKTGFYIFEEFESITDLIIQIRKAKIVPNMQEFLDKMTTNVCFNYLGGDYSNYPRGYFFLVEVDGTQEQTQKEFDQIHEMCMKSQPLFHKIAQDPSDRDNIIQARKVALPALSGLAPTTCIEDCTINITHLSDAMHQIEEIAEKYSKLGMKIATFGHLEGNLHPTFMFNEHKAKDVEYFEKAVDEIYNNVVLPLGGTVTGEHGVGILKARFLVKEHPTSIDLMHKIKTLFDPNDILNPGKAKGSNRKKISNPVKVKQKNLEEIPALSCMRCGFCLTACPSFANFRIESYSPRGKLALVRGVLRGNIPVTDKFRNILYACTLCGACEAKCPALIQTVDLFEGIRTLIATKNAMFSK